MSNKFSQSKQAKISIPNDRGASSDGREGIRAAKLHRSSSTSVEDGVSKKSGTSKSSFRSSWQGK